MDEGIGINIVFILILIVTIVAVIIVFATTQAGAPPPSSISFAGPFDLNGTKTAVDTAQFSTATQSTEFLKRGDGAVSFFVYLEGSAKTGEYIPCGSSPSQPDCDTGLYGTCPCESVTACNACAHGGYKSLLSLYGVYTVELLNVPDASRPNAVAAQATVLTTQPTATGKQLYKETVSLPPFPLQKWTMITIVHEGRRIDVYYNDALVASATLEHTLVTDTISLVPVQVGASGLTGTLGLISFYTRALIVPAVQALYSGQIDTRGAPVALDTRAAEFSATVSRAGEGSLLSRLCLDGSCLGGGGMRAPSVTTTTTANSPSEMGTISALYALDSPYA